MLIRVGDTVEIDANGFGQNLMNTLESTAPTPL
jgi:hypothetical protein